MKAGLSETSLSAFADRSPIISSVGLVLKNRSFELPAALACSNLLRCLGGLHVYWERQHLVVIAGESQIRNRAEQPAACGGVP